MLQGKGANCLDWRLLAVVILKGQITHHYYGGFTEITVNLVLPRTMRYDHEQLLLLTKTVIYSQIKINKTTFFGSKSCILFFSISLQLKYRLQVIHLLNDMHHL